MQVDELNSIVQHYAGSLSYGTNLPTSDVDIRGVFCAEPKNIRTPFYPVREVTLQDEEDGKLYELSTYMHLYTQGNPNILETLWVDNTDIIQGSDVYSYLRGYRTDLLSSKVAFTFSGYAISQLKRIKGHNKWITQEQRGYAKLRASLRSGDISENQIVYHFGEKTLNKVKETK
jgi:predicted nucleotidyltransferase